MRVIETNSNGARISTPHHSAGKGQPVHLQKADKRGAIKGFSKHASQRFREQLWGLQPTQGKELYAITLTVPGDVPLTAAEEKKLWNYFQTMNRRKGLYAGFWRREHQKRGMVHYHLIVSACEGAQGVTSCFHMQDCWRKALDSLGPSTQTTKTGTFTSLRGRMIGFTDHGFLIDRVHNETGLFRYVLDHATKHKREQESPFGRNWGKINAKQFPDYLQHQTGRKTTITDCQHWALHRLIRKWNRPRVKAAGAPFGCKLGWETRRGLSGSAIFYGLPDRMLQYALENPRRGRQSVAYWESQRLQHWLRERSTAA